MGKHTQGIQPMTGSWRRSFTSLDPIVTPTFLLFGRSWTSFTFISAIGFVLANVLVFTLAADQEIPLWIAAALIILAIATFWLHSLIVKIITNKETFIYLRHLIAILLSASLFCRLVNVPLLPHVELIILGIGFQQAIGRLGCCMAGCCHGKPSDWGVCYGSSHVVAGFPAYLAHVRLFPTQLLEFIWGIVSVTVAVTLLQNNYPAGSGLSAYLILYAMGRFFLEFYRGDDKRIYIGLFSEAQWISLIMLFSVTAAGFAGLVPYFPWHIFCVICVIFAICKVLLKSYHFQQAAFFHPRHIREIAGIIDLLHVPERPERLSISYAATNPIMLAKTRLGLRISTAKMDHNEERINYFAFSSHDDILPKNIGRDISRLFLRLRRKPSALFFEGKPGVFHLLEGKHSELCQAGEYIKVNVPERSTG